MSRYSASQLAQTTLRSVLGKHELDELLAERDRLNADIQEILDQQTDAWGIKVTNVEIKHVDLNENMIRAIAKQAEAERLRRAKVINVVGEQQAAEKLVEAGQLLAREPQAMQLRYFAALHDIASERCGDHGVVMQSRSGDQDNPLVPAHYRMRVFDRDLIRGGHYGQRSCEPHLQAEHMAAPTKPEDFFCQPGAVHTWLPAQRSTQQTC
jgi:hypothetical protein